MDDDRTSVSKSEEELAEADLEIRAALQKLDETHLKLYASATVILELFRKQMSRTKSVITTLAEIDADWAQLASGRLREAILEAEIKRGDREANMLLSLPKQTEEALAEWVRYMRLGDTNSDALLAACRYGLTRSRTLDSAVKTMASELSAIDSEQARVCAIELRG